MKCSNEIHVITFDDNYTDCSLTIGVANLIGKKRIRDGKAKSYRVDSFKIAIFGYGTLWREFVRKTDN